MNLRNRKNHIVIIFLALILIIQSPTPYSATNVKTKVVQIPRGKADVRTLTKTIEIPNLDKIINVEVNTGNISYKVEGDKVTLTAKNGSPVSETNNSRKYSKTETATRSARNTSGLPKTVNYSYKGYEGELNRIESSIKEAKTRENVSFIYDSFRYRDEAEDKGRELKESGEIKALECRSEDPEIDRYHLSYTGDPFARFCSRADNSSMSWHVEKNDDPYESFNQDLVITVYGDIQGGVESQYRGTVYKPGVDKFYSYTATIEYTDNSAPEIYDEGSLDIFLNNQNTENYKLDVLVKDNDKGDELKTYYSLNGKTIEAGELIANGSKQPQELIIDLESLKEGSHKIKFWVEDQYGSKSKDIIKTIVVDNTPPKINILNVK